MIHIGGVVLYCWGGGGRGRGRGRRTMIHIGGVVLYCWGGGGGGGAKQAMQRAPVSTSKQSIFCVLSACNINMFCALAAQW